MVETNYSDKLPHTGKEIKEKNKNNKANESFFYPEITKDDLLEKKRNSVPLILNLSNKNSKFKKTSKKNKGENLLADIAYILDDSPMSYSSFYEFSDEKAKVNQSKKKPHLQRSSNFETPDDSRNEKKNEQKTRNKKTNIPASDALSDYVYDKMPLNNQEPKSKKKSHRIADQSVENCTTRIPKNKNESQGPNLSPHPKIESPLKPPHPLYEDSNSICFERTSGSSDGQFKGDLLISPDRGDSSESLSTQNILKLHSNEGDSTNDIISLTNERSGSQEIPLENKKISNLMQEFPNLQGNENSDNKKKATINRARSEKISGLAGKLGNIDITKTMGPRSGMGSLKMRRAATKPQHSEDPPVEHVPRESTVESPESGHSLVDTIKSRPKSFHGKKRPPTKKFLRDTLVKQNDSSLSGDLLFGYDDPSPSSERPFSNFENFDSISQGPETSVLPGEEFFSAEEVSEYQKKSDELLKGYDSLRD